MDVVGRGQSDWLERKDYDFDLYLSDAAALLARVTAPVPESRFGHFVECDLRAAGPGIRFAARADGRRDEAAERAGARCGANIHTGFRRFAVSLRSAKPVAFLNSVDYLCAVFIGRATNSSRRKSPASTAAIVACRRLMRSVNSFAPNTLARASPRACMPSRSVRMDCKNSVVRSVRSCRHHPD